MLKKIRLTIFYTDEEIYNIVKNSGLNTKMVSWANEFYKRYNYELDIFPLPYSKNLYEETFILKEKDGTTIPFHFLEGIDTLEAKSEELSKEILRLRRQGRITDVPATRQMNIERLLNEHRNLFSESCIKLRVECHNKFRDDYPEKKPARLVVIYCRSENPQYTLSGGTVRNMGNWLPFILIPVVAGKDDFTTLVNTFKEQEDFEGFKLAVIVNFATNTSISAEELIKEDTSKLASTLYDEAVKQYQHKKKDRPAFAHLYYHTATISLPHIHARNNSNAR